MTEPSDRPTDAEPDACPAEDVFMALLEGGMEGEARLALDAHIDRCAACTALMADLAELVASGGGREAVVVAGGGGGAEPSKIGGRYAIQRMVGRGGMGSVFEAFDESLGRKVAIKVLRADLIEPERRQEHAARLLREARMLAAVYHPNVLNVYDVGMFEGQVYMAIQYIEGSTLREWIRETSPGWRLILEVYLKVGEGLAEAHKQGLVHRDIKPDNILMDPSGRAWLADFGLACAIGAELVVEAVADEDVVDDEAGLLRSMVTRTGAVVGTPAYMAPEQHLAQDTDERTDQFSLAAAIFESLYQRRAFAGRTRLALKAAVCEGEVTSRPPGPVPAPVYAVLRRALSTRPVARFETLSDFLVALRGAAEQAPLWRRTLRVAAWMGLAVAVLIGLGATALVGLAVATVDEAPALPSEASEDGRPAGLAAEPGPAPASVSPKDVLARDVAQLKVERILCQQDVEQCEALIAHLGACCVQTDVEGIPINETERFRAGSEGLADRFLTLCDAGSGQACVMSAFAWVLSFHEYTFPEGSMVPRFVETMRKACEGGAAIGCAAMQDAYAEGQYAREGEHSVKEDIPGFIAILDGSCDAGFGRACWLIAETLLASRHVKHGPKPDARGLEYAAKGCERGWALACLMGGLGYRALSPETCLSDTRPLLSKIPDNDLFDYTASWSDVEVFCRRFGPLGDNVRARALLDRGCGLPAEGEDEAARDNQRVSSGLCCSQRESLDALIGASPQ